MYNCKICDQFFENLKDLHTHISKSEKVKLVDYYHKYYPRKDKWTNKLIKFKNHDFYFNSDFNSRSNFLKWFVKNIEDKNTTDYCYKKLKERIKNKKLNFAPSHVELCSLMIPNIKGFEAIDSIAGYLTFCKKNKLKNRYEYINRKIRKSNKDIEIIIDTREQNPWIFDLKTVSKKLDFGDYAIEGSKLAIERKSLNDFVGTMSSGISRFEKEIKRSGYLVVMIEAPLKEAVNYQPPKWNKWQKANGAFIFHKLRYLSQKYENIQFLFTDNRETSSEMCKKILKMNPNKVKKTDLQWAYDNQLI